MRRLSDLGLSTWDPDAVTAWAMAVPPSEIRGMIEWLSGCIGETGDAKSRFSVSVIRGLLYDRVAGATTEDLRAKARHWTEVLAPQRVAL